MHKLKVALVTDNASDLPEWVLSKLEKAGLELIARKCHSPEELLEYAKSADVIWTRGRNEVVTADILPELKNCRAIMRSGSGLDDIPVEAARQLGIKTLNTPEAIAETVAEHAVALLFALVRQIPQHDKAVRNGSWVSDGSWAGWHVPGQTLGLIGFGLIAQHVVKMLQGFDMKFLAFDPYADLKLFAARGVAPVTFEAAITEADFVSVHCPLTAETEHLFGEKEFKQMKENAFFINTSRGGVVDESALVKALREGWIAGAALDVTEPEPPCQDNPLLELDNVIMTPHIAAFSDQFTRRFWQASIDKLKSLK